MKWVPMHCRCEQPVTWGDANVLEVYLASVQAAVVETHR